MNSSHLAHIRAFIRFSLLCVFSIFHYSYSFSQNHNELSYIFEHLDLNRVPTGYLIDKAIESVNLPTYNGVLSSNNYSDVSVFRNALETINSSRVNETGAFYDAISITNSLAEANVVNLGAIAIKYNYIVDNAVSNNLINYQGGQLYDVFTGGIWQNPYAESRAFVFAPSLSGYIGTSVRFKFSASHFYGNITPISIQFDPGDCYYHSITLPYDNTIIYNTSGKKTLRLKITFSDNSIMESHAFFDVFDIPEVPTSTNNPVSSVVHLNSNEDISAIVTYQSAHGGSIIKPFIYVEGFDNAALGWIDALSDVLDTNNLKKTFNQLQQEGIFDALTNRVLGKSIGVFDFSWFYDSVLNNSIIKDQYDVFYIDWKNPEADIRFNAALLAQIINTINDLKSTSAERNIIVGHSMGGLIARYALKSIELSGNLHETSHYISFDSPQLGVNVPIGFQYAIRDLYKLLYGSPHQVELLTFHLGDPIVSYIFDIFNCKSAKQMMYYSVDTDGSLNDADHLEWQAYLNQYGYPQGDPGYPIELLSIVNGGSNSPATSLLFDFNMHIEEVINSDSFWDYLLSPLLRRKSLNISMTVNRDYGPGSTVSNTVAETIKLWRWTTDTTTVSLFPNGYATIHESPLNSLSLDNIRSSLLLQDDKNKDIAYGCDSLCFHYRAPIFFVPAASALASTEYNRDFYSSPPRPHTDTPFDSYYLSNSAQGHAQISSNFWNWIIAQKNLEMTGPEGIVFTGDTFNVTGVPSDYNYPDWSKSSSSVLVTNGVVNVRNPGTLATILYRNNNGGAYLHKRKKVIAGAPDFWLNATYLNGNNYCVNANFVSEDLELRDKLDELASSGIVSFIWGYKNSDNSYTWTDTTSVRAFNCTAPPGVKTHICMKLYNGPGREGPVCMYVINRTSSTKYLVDPQEIWVNNIGYSMNYQYVSGLSSSKYLAVWCNPNYSGNPPAPIPDSVDVGGTYYPVVSTIYQNIDGQMTTIYCFDIKNSPAVQSAIIDVREGNYPVGSLVRAVSIGIRSNGTTLEYLMLPVVSRIMPGPFDPILF